MYILNPRGGHWPRKGVWGCAAVMTPFFQATRRSLAYQFTITAPLLCPPFSNFRKNFNFQPCFGQNFSSQDANFPNFRSLGPSFFKENPLPRPYLWKPVWHTPTKKKKKVECPPPGINLKTFEIYFSGGEIYFSGGEIYFSGGEIYFSGGKLWRSMIYMTCLCSKCRN